MLSVNGGTSTESPTVRQRRRYQKGQLQKKAGSWIARYYGWSEDGGGARVWRERSTTIGTIKDYPRRADIQDDFVEFMREINAMATESRPGDPTFPYFVDRIYFESPAIKSLAPSTLHGYKDMWRLHLKPLMSQATLGEFRSVTCNQLLEKLANDSSLSKTTLQHIKAFISGVYTFARNHGHYDGANPVQGVKLPKAKPPQETYAYSVKEELAMLNTVTSKRGRLAIAIAAFSGCDKGEIEGLRWEDRVGRDLYVQRKVWCGQVKEPKTEKRKAPIPIIPLLAKYLDEAWEAAGLARPRLDIHCLAREEAAADGQSLPTRDHS